MEKEGGELREMGEREKKREETPYKTETKRGTTSLYQSLLFC